MPSSRDDDLDWLYGRAPRPTAEPEPTRILPALPPHTTRTSPEPVEGAGTDRPPTQTSPEPAGWAGAGQPPARTSPEPAGWAGADQPPTQTSPEPAGWAGAGQPPTQTFPEPVEGPHPLKPAKKHRPVRTILLACMILALLLVGGVVAVPVYAWNQVARVDEAPTGTRPADQPGKTFLLVGSDSRAGLSKADQKRLGTGSTVGQRTDTMMILYIPPGGKPALISIPRDSYVSIPKNGKNKINAAFAFGGAKLLVQTVEQNTGLRMDGYLEIGFGGFVNIIDALGGIEMCLPKKIKDKDSHLNLPQGCQTLGGTDALGYVRMRKADPRGDLGRVERQRAMLAAVAKKGGSPGSVLNPFRYWKLCNATANSVTLGETTTFGQMVSLGLAMKKVSGGAGLTLTVPISNADASTPAGSAVLWDETKAKAMFADIARGDTSDLAKYAK